MWAGRAGLRLPLTTDMQLVLVAVPIASTILIGMVLGLGTLTTAGAAAAMVVAVISPPVGLLVLAFMGPLKPPEVIPAPGFNFLLVGAVLTGCIYRLPVDRPRVRLTAPLLLALAFFLYVFVQQSPEMVAGYAGDTAHRIGFQFFQLAAGVGAVVAAGFVLSQRPPYIFLAAALAAACVASVLAISTYDAGAAGSPFGGLLAATDDDTRAVGPFGNPNYFGQFLATAIAAAVGWALVTTRQTQRWLLIIIAGVAGAALVLSLSRGGIVALLAGMACLALQRSRPLGAALIVVALLAVGVVYPAFVDWRLGSSTDFAYTALQSSDSSRLDAALAGPRLFLSDPLFGIGFGQYSELSARFTQTHIPIGSHNWYMSVLAEQGLVGVALWSLLLVSVVVGLRSRPTSARWIGYGVLAVFAVGSLFTTQPVSFQTSILPVIVITATLVSDWTQTDTMPAGPFRFGRLRPAKAV